MVERICQRAICDFQRNMQTVSYEVTTDNSVVRLLDRDKITEVKEFCKSASKTMTTEKSLLTLLGCFDKIKT